MERPILSVVSSFAALTGVSASASVQFTECAAEVDVVAQFQPDASYMAGLAHMIAGGAVGDFNNDGWQDLFVVSGGAQPDRLFINDGDGTFTDQAASWGVDELHKGAGVAVADFNGDGWLDLFVSSYGPSGQPMTNGAHKLYRNNGNGTFTDIAGTAGVATSDTVRNAFSAAFGDYDLDGDLDLYVSGWFVEGENGNRLFRNNGDETFTDVTQVAGLWETQVYGFTPRLIDMDGDRYPELLLAADFETSQYYINNGDGTFTNATASSGTGLDCNGMGATVGDFDNDGLFDWYVTNIYNLAFDGELCVERPCGNMLYRNLGGHEYEEIAGCVDVIHGYWGWGAVAADLDLDGWQDLVEVNGFQDDSFQELWSNKPARVWVNQGGTSFNEVAAASQFDHTGQGRGLAEADIDNDGDVDVIVFSSPDDNPAWPVMIYRNDTVTTNGWLRVFLDGTTNSEIAPNGVGARVKITTGNGTQHRYIDAGGAFLSQGELSAHFGLGDATIVNELRIEWPNGDISILEQVAANQTLMVPAPARPGDMNADGVIDSTDLFDLLGQWGPCQGCQADLNGDGAVDSTDLFELLGGWG